MRRSRSAPVLALGLLLAPLLALPATASTAVTGPPSAVASGAVTAEGTSATRLIASRAAATTALRTTRAATPARAAAVTRLPARAVKPVVKPAVKPVVKPVTQPAAARPASTASGTATGAYAFLHLDKGAPVRWNPCADVPWLFNPTGAPAGGLGAVQAALAEISRRTGLTFAYGGTSDAAVGAGWLTQEWGGFRPLLVGWTTAGASDLLAGKGSSTVGVARVLWTGSYDSAGADRTQIASGVVALNAATTAPTTGTGSWFTYALHELGHAVGLAHVEDSSQVMHAVIARSTAGFGSGDLAGLAKVGRGAGCLPDVR